MAGRIIHGKNKSKTGAAPFHYIVECKRTENKI
jgi:hypothetical protein